MKKNGAIEPYMRVSFIVVCNCHITIIIIGCEILIFLPWFNGKQKRIVTSPEFNAIKQLDNREPIEKVVYFSTTHYIIKTKAEADAENHYSKNNVNTVC